MHEIVEANDVRIVRTQAGFVVGMTKQPDGHPLKVEIDYRGQRINEYTFNPCVPIRDILPVDAMKCEITVRNMDGAVLAVAAAPEGEKPFHPYMVRSGPQFHITESYVSSPPALTITDEAGAVWTLGEIRTHNDLAPHGEFAFAVLRNGVDTRELASRIERRAGKIRIFTKHGWRVWNQLGGYFI